MNTIYRSNLFAECLVIIYILGSLTLSILFSITGITPAPWLRSVLQYILLFGIPSWLFMRHFGMTPKGTLRLQRPSSPLLVLYTVLFALFMQPPLMSLSLLSEKIFYNHVASSLENALSYPLPLVLLGSAVCPALFEEWACRGIFLSGYRNAHPLKAALLCGIFFGILHMNMQQFVYAAFFGFAISLLCLSADCLWLPILAHFLINATQLLLSDLSVMPFPSEAAAMITGILCLPVLCGLLAAIRHCKGISTPGTDTLRGQMKPFYITILIFGLALLLLR